jgi:dTDP-4-amino-4,6-dideoxygalactose transaminase
MAFGAGGAATRRLQDEIRQAFGTSHVFLVSSGTAALAVTFTALKLLSPARQAVLPAFTCPAVPAAILHAGLEPAPCDINPATFDFDDRAFVHTLTDGTLCVVAHHLFGVPSDIGRIQRECRRRGIFVVEDAAQAMGVEVNGRRLGTLGDVGIFSFGRGKNISCGGGGAIVTNDERIAAAIDRVYCDLRPASLGGQAREYLRVVLMAIFIHPRLYWIPARMPSLKLGQTIIPEHIAAMRLGGVQAGLLRGWRGRLVRANRARAETARYFERYLSLPVSPAGAVPYLRFPVAAADAGERARIDALSRRLGLGISGGYSISVDAIPEVRSACGERRFPQAERLAATLLTLPTHHRVSNRDKRAIVGLLRQADLARAARGPAAALQLQAARV